MSDPFVHPVVVASVSGGKDSTALSLWLKEHDIPHRRIFMDTGWENADTYAYLREYLPSVLGPIEWLRADIPVPPGAEAEVAEVEAMLGHESAMVRLVIWKGMFPARLLRFCTEHLKVKPAIKLFKSIGGGGRL